MMQPRTSIGICICFLLSLVATPAMAVEFAVVGPRAAGMGGAGVAVTTDAYATYWNPAGLAMVKSMDVRIQGTTQVTDRLGVGSALHDLQNFDPKMRHPLAWKARARNRSTRRRNSLGGRRSCFRTLW
jgi:hypothetical protein